MRTHGGWVYTLRLITVLTMPLADHGITATVVATGQDAATQTGVGPATIVAA